VLSLNLTCFLFSDCRIELAPHDLPMRSDILPVLRVASLGHALLAFVNGKYVGEHIQSSTYYILVTYKSVTCKLYIANCAYGFQDRHMGAMTRRTLSLSMAWTSSPGSTIYNCFA
jgi:hypothetical protein